MHFEWDEEKNKANIQKHGLDFAEAREIFTAPILVALDDREDYGEDIIRVISLRKALTHERNQYEKVLKDQLGTD